MSIIKICSKCVMDTTDSKIVFDDEGVCDHCKTFEEKIKPHWNVDDSANSELVQLIENVKKSSKNLDFDCILGLSGGFDSSFLLHKVVKDFGLSPLVFHVDAGWNSQTAVNNIECMIDKLNLDLFTEVINWEEMKDLQLSFFKSGVPHIDTPQDHAFFATMYKFSSKYNVKNILTGGNYSTECVRNPIEWMYYQSDSYQIKDIHSKFGSIPLKTFPLTSILWHKFYLPYFRGIRVHRPLDMMPYKKENAKNLLINEYGWEEYTQKHFESRFTRFFESYWLPERFGFDTRKVQYSSLILTNQMTRVEALERLKKPAYDPNTIKNDIEYVANKLNITIEELKSYLFIEKKTYKDYKSQYVLYEIGSRILKALNIELGGKR